MFRRVEQYIRTNVHNPLSTMSNLSYGIFGYLTLGVNPVIGFLQIVLFVASSGFHWVRNDCWHKADILAIFYVFGSIAGFLFAGNAGLVIGLGVAGVGQYLYMKKIVGSRQTIGVLGILTLVPFWILNGWEDSLFVLMWFSLAFAVSTLGSYFNPEEDGKWYDCFHAIWHIFSGVGIYYLGLGTAKTLFTINF